MASIPKKSKVPARSAPQRPGVRLSPRGRGSAAPVADEDQLLKLFAENLRRVRIARGLSQERLGDAADLDRTYISGIERGIRNVSIRNIQRLAEALSFSARDLLDPDLKLNPQFAATNWRAGAGRPASSGKN